MLCKNRKSSDNRWTIKKRFPLVIKIVFYSHIINLKIKNFLSKPENAREYSNTIQKLSL